MASFISDGRSLRNTRRRIFTDPTDPEIEMAITEPNIPIAPRTDVEENTA